MKVITRGKFAIAFLLIFAAFGCVRDTVVETGNSAGQRPEQARQKISPTPAAMIAPLNEKADRELERAIAEIAANAGGKVGVGAVLLETGDAAWLNKGEKFATQSVYKVPIAMAALKMVDDGKVRIDQDISVTPDDYVRRGYHSPIRNLFPQGTSLPLTTILYYSISESDGSANDVLLDMAGGPQAVQNYLATFGIKDFIVADSTKAISMDWDAQYRNYATPAESINLLRAIAERKANLSNFANDLLIEFMSRSKTGRRRLKRGLPEGAVLAHKTGTGGTESQVPGSHRSEEEEDIGDREPGPKTRPTPKAKASPTRRKIDRKTSANSNANEVEKPAGPVVSATNDVGIITLPDGRHILIAVYIQDSTADGWTRERVIADIAKAVCTRWTTGEIPEMANYGAKS
jgi:beta-lactamase class A